MEPGWSDDKNDNPRSLVLLAGTINNRRDAQHTNTDNLYNLARHTARGESYVARQTLVRECVERRFVRDKMLGKLSCQLDTGNRDDSKPRLLSSLIINKPGESYRLSGTGNDDTLSGTKWPLEIRKSNVHCWRYSGEVRGGPDFG